MTIEDTVSAPFAPRQLADLDARIIKREHADAVRSSLDSTEEIAVLRAEAVV